MNYPATSCGVSKTSVMVFPKVVTPERFNRGSTLLTTTLSILSKGSGGQSEFGLDSPCGVAVHYSTGRE